MGNDEQPGRKNSKLRRRKVVFVCLLFFALLAIFHRPILLSIGRKVALHFAANENLRADFRLEGTVFTGFVVRNLHVIPTGPSPVESIDADFIRADYSLFALVFHGLAGFMSNVEVRSASIVLDPGKAPLPKLKKRPTLPGLFPEQLQSGKRQPEDSFKAGRSGGEQSRAGSLSGSGREAGD